MRCQTNVFPNKHISASASIDQNGNVFEIEKISMQKKILQPPVKVGYQILLHIVCLITEINFTSSYQAHVNDQSSVTILVDSRAISIVE